MNRLGAGALLLAALPLQGCDPVTIMAGISASKALYDTVTMVVAADTAALAVVCQRWAISKATGAQRATDGKVSDTKISEASGLAPWLDDTCDPAAPPPKDPLAAAVWLAILIGKHDQIMGVSP